MQYNHTSEKARGYANQALERIMADKLSPTPPNFELWYAYYSQHSLDVVQAIDNITQSKQVFTDETCRELYNQFLNHTRISEAVLTKAEGLVVETMTNVTQAAQVVKTKTAAYEIGLQESASLIKGDVPLETMRELAQNMVVDAQRMVAENKELEERLLQSAHLMQELRLEMETVRMEAMTDALTGIANRKLFDIEIQRIIEESQSEGKDVSLLMIDIDHFKNFNDIYGHQVGDQVLKLVARTLKDGVKGRDLPARYGGEEFAVVLPETSLRAADIVGNALRVAVAEKEVMNRTTGERMGKITLSVGAAQLRRDEKPTSLIARADQALYRAKNDGRNRVVTDDINR